MVDMLESCLSQRGSGEKGKKREKEAAPGPHAKIASDILSCLFLVKMANWSDNAHCLPYTELLQHYGKKSVMTVAIPVAVNALQTGDKDLIRNTSSYLALAAIHNARLLAQYALPIVNSITSG